MQAIEFWVFQYITHANYNSNTNCYLIISSIISFSFKFLILIDSLGY